MVMTEGVLLPSSHLVHVTVEEFERLKWDTSGNQHGTLLLSDDSAEGLARGVDCYYFRHLATEGDRVTIELKESRNRYAFTRGLLLHGGPNGHVTHLRFVRAFPAKPRDASCDQSQSVTLDDVVMGAASR